MTTTRTRSRIARRPLAAAATAVLTTGGLLAGAGVASAQDTGSVGVGTGSAGPPTIGSLHNDVTAPFLDSIAVTTTLTQPPGPRAAADCEDVRTADRDLNPLHWGYTDCVEGPDGSWSFGFRHLPPPLNVALAQVLSHS